MTWDIRRDGDRLVVNGVEIPQEGEATYEEWHRACERAWFAGLDAAAKLAYLDLKREAIAYDLMHPRRREAARSR